MMLVIRVCLSVDESSSSVLYLFQVVDISVVVGFQIMYEYSRLGRAIVSPPPGVCASLIPENKALISPNP